MVRYTTIEDYIRDLKRELREVDEAIISDAIDDTEEHLGLKVQELMEEGGAKLKEEAVARAVADFGTPSEVARAYLEMNDELKGKEEKRQKKKEKRSLFCDIFCIYGDWRVYTGLIYLLLMFPLGVIYFTYMVTMISLGIGMLVTVLGIFILILFLLSNYGLSWLHSRMTEAMLGIRMPRKPRKLRAKGTRWQRIKAMFRDPRMYSSLLYMFLMFPLGIVYFTVFVTLISTSIALMMSPFTILLSEVLNVPIMMPVPPEARAVLIPLAVVLGFLLLTWTLHLSSIFANLHGKLTRGLLLKR